MSATTDLLRTWTDKPTAFRIPTEPWRKDAICAETDPDAFFAEGKGTQYADARAICYRCPVMDACLEYALRNNEEHGLWGGKTPMQRRNLRKGRAA